MLRSWRKPRTAFKKQKSKSIAYWLAVAYHTLEDGKVGFAEDAFNAAKSVARELPKDCKKSLRRNRRASWRFVQKLIEDGTIDHLIEED